MQTQQSSSKRKQNMVKVYKQGMPATYIYEEAGKHEVKIVGNLSSVAFSNNAADNGMPYTLKTVDKLDEHIAVLEDYAFFNC